MRRPGVRSLAGGAAGIAAGIIGGIALTGLSTAGVPVAAPTPALEAMHLPPALTVAGERVTLRYAILCPPRDHGEACRGSGDVYARPGQAGRFERIPLERGADSGAGRYYAILPPRIAAADGGFSYYAVLRDESTGADLTLPAGGALAPERSFPLFSPVSLRLGTHLFGDTRAASDRLVQSAWGSGPGELGLAGSRELGFAGPSSFDVGRDGTVTVLDQVNARAERWEHGHATVVPLTVSGGLADFGVEPDGTMDVLEPPNRTTPAPLLRSFRADGAGRWTQRLADRTWAKLAIGPDGPAVQQQPSEQWLPVAARGAALARSEQSMRGRPGRPFTGGREVIVDRVGSGELRLAEVVGNTTRRGWRITSETPLGEVQLAEPYRDGLLVVAKTYTDARAEYLVLLLDGTGLADAFSVQSLEWAESAPLARFRLSGTSLYRLGSAPGGAFVDRFDLEGSG
jgi:hypothetical protein